MFDRPAKGQEEFVKEWNETSPKDRHIIVIDEFGNTGPKHSKETHFGFGVSEVSSPHVYMGVSKVLRKFHKTDEKKAHDSTQAERILVTAAIASTGTKTSSLYVDKDDLPEVMAKGDKQQKIRGMLGRTLDKTLPEDGIVWVVVDHNDQYGGNSPVRRICSARGTDSRTVYGEQYRSVGNSDPQSLIQTNDFVANAADSNLVFGKKFRSKLLRMKMTRMNRDSRFKESDLHGPPNNKKGRK